MKEIARGTAYLHSKSIVHRDLSSSNILFTSNNTAKVSMRCLGACSRILHSNPFECLTLRRFPADCRLWLCPQVQCQWYVRLKEHRRNPGIHVYRADCRKTTLMQDRRVCTGVPAVGDRHTQRQLEVPMEYQGSPTAWR
eukprot:1227080-Rhodomonas_salina.2